MQKVVSLMSGTSLDGVDIAFCEFENRNGWQFRLIEGRTIPYEASWKKRLSEAHKLSALDFSLLNVEYGTFLGTLVDKFCHDKNLRPDFVSSHGHTIFHQPHQKLTVQIGSGAAISATCNLTVVCDFRTLDVANGGQGAPLVPIGDRMLFGEYNYCLNLGGIANISYELNGERKAFDICACNIVLNHYASKRNLEYDKDGLLASNGKVDDELLNELSILPYYRKSFPKSLGREDIDRDIFPLIDRHELSIEDTLATFVTHIGEQIAETTKRGGEKMLVTGGGAFNKTLIQRLSEKSKVIVYVPEKTLVEFKEAIVFGFLGVLRMNSVNNCLASVTGAETDNCGGAVYFSSRG